MTTMTKKLGAFVDGLKDTVEYNKKELAAFATSLADDPTYALSWSFKMFDVAADLKLAQETLNTIEFQTEKEGGVMTEEMAEKLLKWVKQTLTDEIVRAARYVPSSTSVTSNLMEAQTTAAKARMLDKMMWI